MITNKKIVAFLFSITLIVSVSAQNYIYQYQFQFGTSGKGDGQFDSPTGIAVDASGNIYVVDHNNYRVQKFNSNGTFITQWGSNGIGNGQFKFPVAIAVDVFGNVYVTDNDINTNRIQKFTADGTFITSWGAKGSGDGQFKYGPIGIAVDTAGYVYAVDNGNRRVQKFSSSGTFISKWGIYGDCAGCFFEPLYIAADIAGNIYVTDESKGVQKFSSTGTFITKWGETDGYFNIKGPTHIAVDSAGSVYVSDYGNNCVKKFSSVGDYYTQFGSVGKDNGQFYVATGIAVSPSGNVYVVDSKLGRIQVFVSGYLKLKDVEVCAGMQKQDTLNPNFSYAWTPTTGILNTDYKNPIFDGTTSRTYIVNIANGSGYFSTDTVNVNVNACPCPDTSLKSDQQICVGTNYDLNTLKTSTTASGKWSIQGSGANYPTLNGAIFTSTLNTAPGDYIVRYDLTSPSSLCIAYNERTISVVAPPVIEFTAIPDQCLNNPPVDLSLCLSVASANNGVWSGVGVTGNIFNPSAVGIFDINYSVSGVCSLQKTTSIKVKTQANPIISGDSTLCINLPGVQLSADSAGGTWIGTGINTSGYFSTSGLPVGNYSVQYQMNASFCKDTAHYNVRILDVPNVEVYSLDMAVCYGANIHLIDSSQTKGVAYSWSLYNEYSQSVLLNQSSGSSRFYTVSSNIAPGTYKVLMQVTFANGCNNIAERKSAFVVHTYPEADFSFSPNPANNFDSLIQFTNTTSLPYDSLLWSFTAKEKSVVMRGTASQIQNPLTVSFNLAINDTIPVCLIVFSKGCANTYCENVLVKSQTQIFVPNTFTPNGDGINDVFLSDGNYFSIDEYSLMIYDRHGELIFQTDSPITGWNGKRNHNLNDAPMDVYAYIIYYTDHSNGKVKKTLIGKVTLLR